MIYYKYKKGTLPGNEKEHFERVNEGWKCTGETLVEEITDELGTQGCTYVVMKGKFTAYGMCRDCGDHYIIARWCRYDRIDKDDLKITFDVEDI